MVVNWCAAFHHRSRPLPRSGSSTTNPAWASWRRWYDVAPVFSPSRAASVVAVAGPSARSMPSIRTRTGWVSAFSACGDGVIEVRSTRLPYDCKGMFAKVCLEIWLRYRPRRAPRLLAPPSCWPGASRYTRQRLSRPMPRDARTAQSVLREMSLPQRVGQLFMVGTPADEVDRVTKSQIGRFHVGNVMLTGRSYDGVEAPARVSRSMRAEVSAASTSRVRLFVATDQEGGLVRVLQGPGFSEIPSALEQGRWAPSALRRSAEVWAGQLRRAGVNLNLAPVLDTVPSRKAARHNPPIGKYDRQFGFKTTVVTRHGLAFLNGMRAGRVVPAIKHFPGLGRVRANTDTAAGVTDRVTRRHDPYLEPFQKAIDAGAPFVMMSTAIYARLDREAPGRVLAASSSRPCCAETSASAES